MRKMKEKLLKEFSEWLNEEDRKNWEIERYVEAMLDEIIIEMEKMEEIINKQEKTIEEMQEEIDYLKQQ
jgi:cell division septum initiation protein DivIVA